MDNMLTYKEVAQFLKVSERTVWGLVKSGKLKSCTIASRCVRITKEALQEFIKNAQAV